MMQGCFMACCNIFWLILFYLTMFIIICYFDAQLTILKMFEVMFLFSFIILYSQSSVYNRLFLNGRMVAENPLTHTLSRGMQLVFETSEIVGKGYRY